MNNLEELSKLFKRLSKLDYIRPEDVPNIDLYMDQVTTFMDHYMEASKRHPEDKILTKTMINNYAKNDLLPPPVKKKYSKEHMLLLIFIYYFKSILSISDIQTLLHPLTSEYFSGDGQLNLEDIYREVFSLQNEQLDTFTRDVKNKFKSSAKTFENVPEEEREALQSFSFICALSFDVYLKKQMIEAMIDNMAQKAAKRQNKDGSVPKDR